VRVGWNPTSNSEAGTQFGRGGYIVCVARVAGSRSRGGRMHDRIALRLPPRHQGPGVHAFNTIDAWTNSSMISNLKVMGSVLSLLLVRRGSAAVPQWVCSLVIFSSQHLGKNHSSCFLVPRVNQNSALLQEKLNDPAKPITTSCYRCSGRSPTYSDLRLVLP